MDSLENARRGARCKFVGSCGTEVRVKQTVKHAKVGVLIERAMKELVCDFVVNRIGGAPVKHISGCSKRLSPISQWHGSMEAEGADSVVDGVKLCHSAEKCRVGKAKQNAATRHEADMALLTKCHCRPESTREQNQLSLNISKKSTK
jgi:hypothetical protein